MHQTYWDSYPVPGVMVCMVNVIELKLKSSKIHRFSNQPVQWICHFTYLIWIYGWRNLFYITIIPHIRSRLSLIELDIEAIYQAVNFLHRIILCLIVAVHLLSPAISACMCWHFPYNSVLFMFRLYMEHWIHIQISVSILVLRFCFFLLV